MALARRGRIAVLVGVLLATLTAQVWVAVQPTARSMLVVAPSSNGSSGGGERVQAEHLLDEVGAEEELSAHGTTPSLPAFAASSSTTSTLPASAALSSTTALSSPASTALSSTALSSPESAALSSTTSISPASAVLSSISPESTSSSSPAAASTSSSAGLSPPAAAPLLRLAPVAAPGDVNTTATTTTTRWIVTVAVAHAEPPAGWLDVLCFQEAWSVAILEHDAAPWTHADVAEASPWAVGRCHAVTVAQQRALPGQLAAAVVAHGDASVPVAVRRNLGYLYALRNGATVIADLELGLRIRGRRAVHELSPQDQQALLVWRPEDAGHLLADVFGHFGWPALSPRALCATTTTAGAGPPAWRVYNHTLQLCEAPASVPPPPPPPLSIVHALVDLAPGVGPPPTNACPGTPDLDYFFGHSRVQRFCADVPAVQLEPGLFAAVGSRNTVVYADALFTLFLPWGPVDGTEDVLRGFWSQRLLWAFGRRLVVQGPTVEPYEPYDQSKKDDASDDDPEGRLPHWPALLERLRAWQGTAPDMATQLVELVDMLVHEGDVDPVNADLVRAWASDLATLQVRSPQANAVASAPLSDRCPVVSSAATLAKLERCTWRRRWAPHLHPTYDTILIGVHFNNPFYESIPVYLDVYAPAFPNIVFYGVPIESSRNPFTPPYDVTVHLANATDASRNYPEAFYQHVALVDAVTRFPGYAGYLHTNEDVFLNYWRLLSADFGRPWFPALLIDQSYDAVANLAYAEVISNGSRTPFPEGRWHWPGHAQKLANLLPQLPGWAVHGSRAYTNTTGTPLRAVQLLDAAGAYVNPFHRLDSAIATTTTKTSTPPPVGAMDASDVALARREFFFFGGGADFLYLPAQDAGPVTELLRLFGAIIMEMAIPSALVFRFGDTLRSRVYPMQFVYPYGGGDPNAPLETVEGYHPAKLRVVEKTRELLVETTLALSEGAAKAKERPRGF